LTQATLWITNSGEINTNPDEVASISFEPVFKDYFSAQSEAYGEWRPTYPDDLIAYLASLAPGQDLAWDYATGTCQAARSLAAYFDRVVATDASERQIASAPPHQRIDYRVEPAEASEIGSGSLELIAVVQALRVGRYRQPHKASSVPRDRNRLSS